MHTLAKERRIIVKVPHARAGWSLLLLSIAALHGQTLNPVPGFWQDIAGKIPLPANFSIEPQLMITTQGTSTNGNPFAHPRALLFWPWLHFDGIPNLTLTACVNYIYHFAVPTTSAYQHPEWRDTLMGTLKQPMNGGSLYEQVRGELRNFRDSHGRVQHLPRVRFRFGQNLYLREGQSRLKPYLGFYQEAIVQFPQPSYSRVTFSSARFFAGGGFNLGSRTEVLLGFKAEGNVSTSGSSVTLIFGPAFSIDYNFRALKPIHLNHHRTTAFQDF